MHFGGLKMFSLSGLENNVNILEVNWNFNVISSKMIKSKAFSATG